MSRSKIKGLSSPRPREIYLGLSALRLQCFVTLCDLTQCGAALLTLRIEVVLQFADLQLKVLDRDVLRLHQFRVLGWVLVTNPRALGVRRHSVSRTENL